LVTIRLKSRVEKLIREACASSVGGALLLTPGFITDIFGLIFLIPPTRAIVRHLMSGYVTRRFVIVGAPGSAGPAGPAASSRHYDYDATAEEIDSEDPRLPG
jgi:UPF0716 protein FxsA